MLRTDPTFCPKVSSHFHAAQEICLLSFCPRPAHPLERSWHTLNVRRTLKVFMIWTESIRRSGSLFVSISSPRLGQKMSSSSIGAVIRCCIKEAYWASKLEDPEGIMAHSTRSAATSSAWCNRASVEEICKAAT